MIFWLILTGSNSVNYDEFVRLSSLLKEKNMQYNTRHFNLLPFIKDCFRQNFIIKKLIGI